MGVVLAWTWISFSSIFFLIFVLDPHDVLWTIFHQGFLFVSSRARAAVREVLISGVFTEGPGWVPLPFNRSLSGCVLARAWSFDDVLTLNKLNL